MLPCGNEENVRLAEEIMRYLDGQPHAADTIDGVANWWIKHQRLVESSERIECVLNYLIDRGLVEKVVNVNGTVIYRKARKPTAMP